MYRRIVFLGLGGSGGKTLRFLKRDLSNWLNAHDWPVADRGVPRGFQFLHIDTPTVADGVSMGGADMLPDREYLGLVGAGVNFAAVTSELDNRSGVMYEQAGWRVPAAALDVPIGAGAGAFRAVGRTIAAAQINTMREGIQGLINRVNSPSAIADNSELWTLTQNGAQAGNVSNPIVVVISSLAGGTGAGLLLDVFDILRSLEPTWGGDSFGILYTPEVFRSIGGGMMGGIQPNSLAAISEILNGYYWHGSDDNRGAGVGSDIGLKSSRIHSGAGVVGAISKSGAAYPFLVGSTNSANVSFATDKQVFETIGSALVAWCVDEVVQDQLIAFTMANWQDSASRNLGEADLLINKGTPIEFGMPAFNALGCARVSVGTRYLQLYSSRRLARDAATYIAGYHLESDEARAVIAQTGVVDPEAIAEHIARDKMPWFLKQSQLREKGTDENDILDALKPQEYAARWESAVNTARQLADIERGSAGAWLDSISAAVRQAVVQFDSEMKPLVESRVKNWVDEKPAQVIAVVEESIANFGFKVTVKILDSLTEYLANPVEGVATELMGPNEHQAFSVWSSESEWSNQAAATLGTSKGNFTMQSNEKIGEAISNAMHYAGFVVDAQIREYASLLIKEFVDGFVVPMRRRLADAAIQLETNLNDITGWPTWSAGDPGADCKPPASEYTLIEPDEFNEQFLSLLSQSVGDVDPLERETHRMLARTDVISGAFLRKLEADARENEKVVRPLQAIIVSQPWVPSVGVLRDTNRARANIVVDLKFHPDDMKRRADVWLQREGTAFKNMLTATLRTYTTGSAVFAGNIHVSEPEYVERRTRFLGKLRAAIEASAPLVQLDMALHTTVHEVRGFKRQFSKFPFNGHPLQDAVTDVIRPLIQAGAQDDGNPAQVNSYFVNDASIESIQIISTLRGAHHPILFKSLLQPIAQRWNQENAVPQKRAAFWTKRRARLAGESIPAPQEHIVCMIRGWFTGRMLGLIDVPRNGQVRPISIAQPWSLDTAPARFPDPLLTTPTNAGDELFAVLEALGLAFVNVGVANSTIPLLPYISLREMGSMRDGSERVLAYDTPNPLLKSWILSGELSSNFANHRKDERQLRNGLESNLLDLLAKAPQTPGDRKTTILNLLKTLQEQYASEREAFFNSAQLGRNRLSDPPLWTSLRNTSDQPDLIARALRQLIDGVNGLSISSVTGL